MNSYEIGVRGVFVNYFTIDAEDEDAACMIAMDVFYNDVGDCIDTDIIDVVELGEESSK